MFVFLFLTRPFFILNFIKFQLHSSWEFVACELIKYDGFHYYYYHYFYYYCHYCYYIYSLNKEIGLLSHKYISN